jgi:hypothetical protein
MTHPHELVKKRLARGLIISLIYPGKANYLILELRRAKVYPSTVEWYTVLNHLPFHSAAAPAKRTDKSFFTLLTIIRLQNRLL